MRKTIALMLEVIGKTAGILAALVWGLACWDFLNQQDSNGISDRRVFHMLGLAAFSVPLVGFLVYCPFAALAGRIARSQSRDVP